MPSLSKIYEHVVFEQLLQYMEGNSLFYKDQYGFRPGHSTELASSRFVNELVQNIDNFETPTSILIDLSKAFDTLNHDIMLYKLKFYGISGIALKFLFKLFNRETPIRRLSGEHLSGTINCHGSTTRIGLGTVFVLDIY